VADEFAPVIPDYELLRRIGRGAYGEVWIARNVTGSFVAVKVVARGAFDHDRPFEREFEGIKRFEPISRSDPSQVAILHVGRGEQFFYYVMELADAVEGPKSEPASNSDTEAPELGRRPEFDLRSSDQYVPHTLREDLKRQGRLPVSQCVKIGLALTRALAHLHRCGLVHRDVKASNVIFVGGMPKLADIGLVTSVDATRSLVGTEGYIAPEGPGTAQADLYSLGKVLYEISTGCDRKEFPTLPADIATRPDRGAFIELNAIVMRACQFDPDQRYANAKAMLAELELLHSGHSVQRKRALQHGWAVVLRATLVLFALAVSVASVLILLRQFAGAAFPSDGPPSPDPDANRLCTKAMLDVRGDNYAAFPTAYTNFHRAIARDPNFARPYVGLLELRLRETVPGLPPNRAEELRLCASKLNELAPHSAPAYCAQSIVSWYEWNHAQAKRFIDQAIKTDPKYEQGHTWYAYMLGQWGDPVASREQYKISQRLAPSKVTVYRGLSRTYYIERHYTNAVSWASIALEQEPHHVAAYGLLTGIYLALGDYTNAIESARKEHLLRGENPSETNQFYDALQRAFTAGGAPAYWQECWKHTERNLDEDCYSKAEIQMQLGNTDTAFAWLNKCYEAEMRQGPWHDSGLVELLVEQCWDGVHDDPRFKSLLDRIGFTPMMPRRSK
jgi:serine/threonine protein kinase/Tfp pilus assembly protein PilF